MLPRVFVYGTLMPGHLRWGLIAPYATSHRAAAVPGVLFDTRRGWPAARFAEPLGAPVLVDDPPAGADGAETDAIPGWLVELAPTSAEDLLAQLDEVEGAVVVDDGAPAIERRPGQGSGEYRRVRVTTTDGTEAWAYEASVVGPDWVVVPRWSSEAEN